jgi:lysophospholipase L1-like esterase
MKHLVPLTLLLAAGVAFGADPNWVGTWATAAQPAPPGETEVFRNQTLRLIVHVSAGGKRTRVRLSNLYGNEPLGVGSARIARRAEGADTSPGTDRPLRFAGKSSVTIPPHSEVWSDPVALEVAPISDLAVSLYLPDTTHATTSHLLALQTNYVSAEGDATAAAQFPVARTLTTWPILTGVDVTAPTRGAAIVAFGSSLTDGEGSTDDTNHRWPDLLAQRLRKAGGAFAELGVLNEGIIGNRLLSDSPQGTDSPFGALLGEAGLKRFDRDVLAQSGVRYVVLTLGVNDILFPAFPFVPVGETRTAEDVIGGYRALIARAHAKKVRVIGSTIPPFEGATFGRGSNMLYLYTPERDRTRMTVNEWIRTSGAFDGVIDFDASVRDPSRPSRLEPKFAANDHLHVNDQGNAAQAEAIPLELFSREP